MGLDNEYAAITPPLPPVIVDIETLARDDAADYLEPVSAPANYKDAEKIAAYIKEAQQKALERAALDVDQARILCIGVHTGDDTRGTTVLPCALSEDSERAALETFWGIVGTRQLCGFNILGFDLPMLLRRSLYLGVPTPPVDLNKYRNSQVIDLMLLLSFNGLVPARSLAFYRKRFALAVPDDPTTGKDIAALYAAGDYQAIYDHCTSDVLTTRALAQKVEVA